MPPKDPPKPLPQSIQRAITEGATLTKTPPGGVPETWEDDDQKSNVNEESFGDGLVRRQRTQLKTAQTTLETLVTHDGKITELASQVSVLTGRVSTVENIATEIKRKTVQQSKTLAVQDAKLDTMLTILDPSAPQRVREIVASEIRISEHTEQKQIVVEKTKLNMEIVKQIGAILIAVITGGGIALLARGC